MTSTASDALPSWFDISTPDAARARRFYREMFGWAITAIDDTYALVGPEDGQPTGGIGQAGSNSPYTGMTVYFQVDDVEVALSRALELGGTRVMEPTETPMGQIGVFTDPDGNTVGVQSRSRPRPTTGTV